MTTTKSGDKVGLWLLLPFHGLWDLPISAAELLTSVSTFALIQSCGIFLSLSRDSPLFDFIESCLRNKHEMVVYEAASAIVNLPNCTAKELAPAVSGKCGAHGHGEGIMSLQW